MARRKFTTEFTINSFGSYRVLLKQHDLEDSNLIERLPDAPFHIYMITRRPRVAFDPESILFTEDEVRGTFTIQRQAEMERHDFVTRNLLGTHEVRVECPYPHNEYQIYDKDDNFISGGKVPILLSNLSEQYWEYLDLEVLYVGQSYGTNGSRVAPDRLKSHSTLQGIYAEAINRSPDMDIWIVLWSFEPNLITSVGGFEAAESTMEQDKAHRDKVFSSSISEKQQINFTEAALIRYFQPVYNKIFKDTFPNPAHSSYSECYDLDLNGVSVELQTEGIRSRLWSKVVEPSWVHLPKYELHSADERKSMFEL